VFGKRIQKKRLEKGLSITELAERAGVAKSYLSYIERDLQTNPSIQFLEKIAAVLQVDVQTLLSFEEQTEADSKLDHEWLALIQEAINAGISKDEFREFQEFMAYKKWLKEKKMKKHCRVRSNQVSNEL